jgi:hypothetical protein
MITSIRNIDPKALQRLRVEAKRKGITMGDSLTEAIEQYLTQPNRKFDASKIPVWDWGPGNERVSEEIDEILYGKSTR